jgi:hypothetical protein
LKDPSLLTVKLYDIRHYYATMEQVRYHDTAITATAMGHKDWNTTRKYIALARLIELSELDDQFICKIPTTNEDEARLIEAGYTYIRTREDRKPIYKKRK